MSGPKRWRYWDVTAMICGLLALAATVLAIRLDVWGEALIVQMVATIVVVASSALGWRGGRRGMIVAGLLLTILSWIPLFLIFYSCAILKNCP